VTEGWVEEAYAKYADDLVRFATGLVGPADAADVVSSVMVRVLGRSSARSVDDSRSFLYRSVFNEARMHHRSTMRRRARDLRTASPDWSEDAPTLRPDVLAAVAGLSMRQRAVVVLTYWSDLDDAAVADLLSISPGSVRRHLARARERLRRSINRDEA
jgi:RNA polymerase sigma factor (sigma-70 family)